MWTIKNSKCVELLTHVALCGQLIIMQDVLNAGGRNSKLFNSLLFIYFFFVLPLLPHTMLYRVCLPLSLLYAS
jgi:hypothetical protein